MSVFDYTNYRAIDKQTYNKNMHDLKLLIKTNRQNQLVGQFRNIEATTTKPQSWIFNSAIGNFIVARHAENLIRIRHNTIYRFGLEQYCKRQGIRYIITDKLTPRGREARRAREISEYTRDCSLQLEAEHRGNTTEEELVNPWVVGHITFNTSISTDGFVDLGTCDA